MKNKDKIKFLLREGLSLQTVANLNEAQLDVLTKKFKKGKKEESKEQVQQQQTTKTIVGPKGGNVQLKPGQTTVSLKPVPGGSPGTMEVVEKEIKEDETNDVTSGNALGKDAEQAYTGQEAPHDANDMADDGMDDDSGNNRSMMGMAESTLKERFESKAQQNFFWAKCNTSKGVKKKKWCEMAREFSDSTSKKQYEKMPEKLHPEKTVKYKKEKTNENLEKFLENKIISVLESKVRPRMKKSDLVKLVQEKSESMILRKPKKVTMFSDEAPKMKTPIAKLFSIGKTKK
jgi:hypothetical protein